jgi:hypothetical protein
MCRAPLTWRLAGVRIEISVERGPPPSGVVVVDDGPARHFDGWLGLLRLLADALNPQPSAPYDVRAGVGPRAPCDLP